MGGIGKTLFGSSGSSKTKQSTTMTPEQQALLTSLLNEFRTPKSISEATNIETFNPNTTDPFGAPLSNLQKLSLTSLENLSQEMGSSGTYTAANDALTKQLQTGGKQDITDVFQNSIVNPYLKNFTDTTLPGVTGNFAGTGAYGSDKMKQQNLALRDLNDSVLSAGSKLAYDAGDSANKNILTALGLVPSVTSAGINNNISLLNAGGVEQATKQKQIDTALSYLDSQNQSKNQKLQAMLSALGLKPFENITTTKSGSSGIAGSLISGGASIFAARPSDIRLKSHIHKIGQHVAGFGIYVYKIYNRWESGVMAQDVLKVFPHAVRVGSNGFYEVNYSALNYQPIVGQ